MHRSSATATRCAPPIDHWPGRLVDLGDIELFVRSSPAPEGAEPAMFVHGLGGSSTNWTDLMDALREPAPGQAAWPALSCDAVDLPGHGHSPPARHDDYSIRAQARVVAELIEQRGRGSVHLIGNSLGGAVCTKLAARRPDLVRTLTLISPALPDLRPRLIPARISALRIPGLGTWLIRRSIRMPAPQRVAVTVRDVYFDPGLVHPDRFAEEVAELERADQLGYAGDVLLKSAKAVITEYFRRGRKSLWREAAQVRAPVLAIYGSHDRLVDARMAARAARTFPRIRVVVLPRTGHVAQMERPSEVAREMRIMMSGTTRPSPA
jgi:pimeloyl-ACP methyl ester carboxylesterase